jgi:hypothetical protein
MIWETRLCHGVEVHDQCQGIFRKGWDKTPRQAHHQSDIDIRNGFYLSEVVFREAIE